MKLDTSVDFSFTPCEPQNGYAENFVHIFLSASQDIKYTSYIYNRITEYMPKYSI